jgi:phosphoglycolate phosphatase
MLSKTEVILFDLDGTLVNSFDQIFSAATLARIEKKYRPPSSSFIKEKIGLPASELFSDLELEEPNLLELIKLFRINLSKIKMSDQNLFEGVMELLQYINVCGIRMAVATNKPKRLAIEALSDCRILEFFEDVVGGDNILAKPDPAIINRCLDLLSVKAESALMVGDRIEDIMAANAAGVIAIGVAQGTHSQNEFYDKGAFRSFESISKLSLFLKEGIKHGNI